MVAMVVAQLHQLPYTFTTLRIYTRSYCRFSFATVTSVVLNNKRYLSSELGLRLITTQFPFEPRLKWIANMEISVQISISNTFLPRCVRVYRKPELIDWPRCVSVLLQQRRRNQTFYNFKSNRNDEENMISEVYSNLIWISNIYRHLPTCIVQFYSFRAVIQCNMCYCSTANEWICEH